MPGAGRLRFFPLRNSIPEPYRDFQDVWRTLVIGEAIYFQTFNYRFRYAGGQKKVWRPQDRYHLAFAVHETLFMRIPGLGLNAGMMVTATKSILTTLNHEKDLVPSSRN